MTTTNPGDLMRYHWILSVRLKHGTEATLTGEFNAPPGLTRKKAYEQINQYMKDQTGQNEDGLVLFFALEPNQL